MNLVPVDIDGETYYATQEACDYLEVSRETLNQMTKDGRLHKYRRGVGRTTYYRKTDLDKLRQFHRVEDPEDNQ